jgi:hypothetical protein
MTINVLRNRSRVGESADGLAIGEVDREIFSCPSCARPLAVGVSRCPGCRTRLILEVRLKRASLFVAAGLAVGLLVGAGSVAGVALQANRTGAAEPATAGPAHSAAPGASHAPGAGPVTTRRPSATPAPTVPSLAVSALRQTAIVNRRLVAGGEELRASAADDQDDPGRIAHVLRDLASDAVLGLTVVTRLDGWAEADPVAEDLLDLYSRVRVAAREGLSASLANAPAYRTAAAKMLTLLEGLAAVDASSRQVAADAGVELPDVLEREADGSP